MLIALAVALALIVITVLFRSVRVVPQQRMDVVERLGKYHRTLTPGLNLLVPFIDAVRTKVDMREQVVSFPPQPVITSDNLVVSIDTVLYFKVVDPVRATYEIANFLQAIEQLTVTTLRNVIGSMDLEKALTSRDEINRHLSGVLDETTGRWGIKVTRVEIKAIEPPPSIRDSMEKQMRAERDRRAVILQAEGHKQAQILTAEGEKQAAVLRAEGDRVSRILTAEGQAKAIQTVFDAIHTADPNPQVLAYQYMQALPQIAAGQANKVWIVPAELTRALEGIGGALGGLSGLGVAPGVERPEAKAAVDQEMAQAAEAAAEEARAAATSAADAAREASVAVGGPGSGPGSVTDPESAGPVTTPGSSAAPQQLSAAPRNPASSLLGDEAQPVRQPE
ncbi:SPFH domain-containing protein [Planosporangium flavigriseum]|uniref:SPFH domain-containing protein n=1 Tax=Planosporangium flavigriseum TaxID=373681 RepID=UPI0035712E0F